MTRFRTLLGISVLWLALSMLSDGINTLVLPYHLSQVPGLASPATALGLISFLGLVAGMLIQPIAGAWSDRTRFRWGRRGVIGLGTLAVLLSLALFGLSRGVLAVLIAFVFIQWSASTVQAAQQGFIPDLVPAGQRGTASGLKGLMDLGGALLGFAALGQLLGQGRIGPALGAIGAVFVIGLLVTVSLVPESRPSPPSALPRATWSDAFRFDPRERPAFARLILSRFLFLLGTYAVGRFFLFFVADRMGLAPDRAAEQAGALLAGLALITAFAAPLAGWTADRWGRLPMMWAGAGLSATGALLLTWAAGGVWILLAGGLMALGSAAFSTANWALAADLAPRAEAARFMALANFGTAGAAAAAGLFGPLADWAEAVAPGGRYPFLFIAAALAFVASALALRISEISVHPSTVGSS